MYVIYVLKSSRSAKVPKMGKKLSCSQFMVLGCFIQILRSNSISSYIATLSQELNFKHSCVLIYIWCSVKCCSTARSQAMKPVKGGFCVDKWPVIMWHDIILPSCTEDLEEIASQHACTHKHSLKACVDTSKEASMHNCTDKQAFTENFWNDLSWLALPGPFEYWPTRI